MMRTMCAVLVAAACFTAPGVSQQPTQRQMDSLAAQVRQLRGRLDSVLAVLRRQPVPAPPAAAVGDELAALRAAASQAAGGGLSDSTRGADTLTQAMGRERNQAQLNPEIGVTGDIRGYATARGVQRENFDPREFEVGFQSALDPYSHTKIFISLEGGHVSVEEGYAYWTGLPGRLRLDFGKYRQQFGELNRWHLHAVPETEYPLAIKTFLGEDGLAGTGISLYRAFGGLGTHELTAQVTRSASDSELFGNSGRPTYLLHLLNFWQLNHSTYMQIGGTALYGTNPDSALRTKVGRVEFRLTWRPPLRAMYHELTVRGELLAIKKEVAGTRPAPVGDYLSFTYKINPRLLFGARYDYVESPPSWVVRQGVSSLPMWQSEWGFLRAQYQWRLVGNRPAQHQITLQAVWAIGPHKHETY